jgi:hypothetical protein
MRSLLKSSLEELKDVPNVEPTKESSQPKPDDNKKREDEIVFYAVMKNPEGLKLAADKESQEQWGIKKRKGRVRVRKVTKADLAPTFSLTFKTKSENAGIMGSIEEEYPCEEGMFNSFKNLAEEGMIKDRYFFPVKSVQITTDAGKQDIVVEDVFYEVDVFFNEDKTYNENIKIDLEMNKILDAINKAMPNLGEFKLNVKLLNLPFQPTNVLVSDKNTTEETKEKISQLYDSVFVTKRSDI